MSRSLVALLLASLFVPIAGAQPASPYEVDDPEGDVAAVTAGTRQPLPAIDSLPYVDVTRLEMRDVDEEVLEIRLSNGAGFVDYGGAFSSSYVGYPQLRHRVYFTVAGLGAPPTAAYIETEQMQLRAENQTNAKNDVVTRNVFLCVPLPGNSEADYCDFFSRLYLEHRVDDGVLVVSVPKSYLTSQATVFRSSFGSAGGFALLPPRLFVGDKLTNVHVVGEEILDPFFGFTPLPRPLEVQDRLPDQAMAPDFEFEFPSATNDLILHYPPPSVVAGEETLVPVQVDNLAPVKRIVNFSALLTSDSPGWSVAVTPSATMAAGQSTNVTLRVKAPPLAGGLGSRAEIKLRGDVITQPGNVAVRTIVFASAPPLDANYATFFIAGDRYGSFVVGPSFGFAWMTRLEAEAKASTEPIPFYPFGALISTGPSFRGNQWAFDSWGIPNAALIRPGEQGRGQLEIESPTALDVTISVQLMQRDLIVGQFAGPESLQQGRTVIEFPLTILPDVSRLDPRNGTIVAFLEITSTDPRGLAATWLSFAGEEISFVPGTSWFELPLERDTTVAPIDPPAAVSLSAAEDLEAFINPGRTQVFEFDLRNEDDEALRLFVEASNRSAEWSIEIRPGDRFRLAAGESVRMGVLVTAPAKAAEGSQLKFRLVAKEAETQVPVAAAALHLIVTAGVDVENETFESSTEDAVKLDSPSGSTPWVGSLGLVLVCAVVVGARRRRS